MKKTLFILAFMAAAAGARADDGSSLDLGSQRLGPDLPFEGVVTAVDSNGNDPEHAFTAISEEGIAKVFHISSLQDLDVGDRVRLRYIDGEVYPMMVTTIKFLPPAENLSQN